MPGAALVERYQRALAAHEESVDALVPLLVSMALETVREALPGAVELTFGEADEAVV